MIHLVATSQSGSGPINKASLIANVSQVAAGSTIQLGIRLAPAPGWHTYWLNPGDSGGPTTFSLALPDHWVPGKAIWPTPEILNLSGVISYGYDSEVLIVVPVKVPSEVQSRSFTVTGRAKWLACTSEVCKPADQNISLTLKIGPAMQSSSAPFFARELAKAPVDKPQSGVVATLTSNGLDLRISDVGQSISPKSCYFFPSQTGIVDHSGPEIFSLKGSTLVAKLPKSPYASTPPRRVVGVLAFTRSGKRQSLTIDVPVSPSQSKPQ